MYLKRADCDYIILYVYSKNEIGTRVDVVRVYQFRSECLDDGLRQRKWWPREREEDETALKAKL